jgi:NADH dehydrogenase/NADH:ubiquinone oxidoreductase subunit G
MKSHMTRITVDGKSIEAEQGTTLLQACLDNGIYIPNLCFLKGMKEPLASCRLCFVEVQGGPAPVPSCAVVVKDGMEVRTDTPEVRALQKAAFRLFMSVHRVDCAHCPANKRCELQRIGRFLKVGLKPSGLEQYFKEPEVIREHPAIDYYPNRCVLCGRCVHTCLSNAGRPLMTFAKRGFNTIISFYGTNEGGPSCSDCRSCVDVCPVSALVLRGS